MAGYAKIWTTIFLDEWFLGLSLIQRGVWLQLIVLAKAQTDDGKIRGKNWENYGTFLGGDRETSRKILGKFAKDEKIQLSQNGSGVIEVQIENYQYWQGLRDVKEAVSRPSKSRKVPEKSGEIPLARANQNRPDHNRTEQTLPKPPLIPFQEILDDLNTRIGKRYTSTPKHRELISARWKEGHGLDDFRAVHSNMIEAWKDDPKMREYLRPVTLYSPKFESYLNRIGKQPLDGLSEHGRKTLMAGKEWLDESKGQD